MPRTLPRVSEENSRVPLSPKAARGRAKGHPNCGRAQMRHGDLRSRSPVRERSPLSAMIWRGPNDGTQPRGASRSIHPVRRPPRFGVERAPLGLDLDLPLRK